MSAGLIQRAPWMSVNMKLHEIFWQEWAEMCKRWLKIWSWMKDGSKSDLFVTLVFQFDCSDLLLDAHKPLFLYFYVLSDISQPCTCPSVTSRCGRTTNQHLFLQRHFPQRDLISSLQAHACSWGHLISLLFHSVSGPWIICITHGHVKDLINIPDLAEGYSSIFTLTPHRLGPVCPPARPLPCVMNNQPSHYANSGLLSLKKRKPIISWISKTLGAHLENVGSHNNISRVR